MNTYVRSLSLTAAVLLSPSFATAGDGCLLEQLFAIPKSLLSGGHSENCRQAPQCCDTPVQTCHPKRFTESAKVQKTTATTVCALYEYMNWGTYKSYYGMECAMGMPLSIDGNITINGDCSDLDPLPANCFAINMAFRKKSTGNGHGHKPGTGPITKIPKEKRNQKGASGNKVKVRYITNKPIFVKFSVNAKTVHCRLWILEVTQKTPGNPVVPSLFAVGQEVEEFSPVGMEVISELQPKQVKVVGDFVVQLQYGPVTLQAVTETKLR